MLNDRVSENIVTTNIFITLLLSIRCSETCLFSAFFIDIPYSLFLRQTPEAALFYIDWAYKKEAWSSYLLPAPLAEAFALPIPVKRATQKSTLYNDKEISYNADIYRCCCFDRNSEVCEVSASQNKA